MDSTQRKGINFDLDTEALQKYYPKGDWHNAYYDVRAYFEKNGFEHIRVLDTILLRLCQKQRQCQLFTK